MKNTDSLSVAIVTKYHGPTNSKGSRVTANAGLGRKVSVPLDHSLSTFDAHAKAARALCEKFRWRGDLIGGGTETGYAFVFVKGIQ